MANVFGFRRDSFKMLLLLGMIFMSQWKGISGLVMVCLLDAEINLSIPIPLHFGFSVPPLENP